MKALFVSPDCTEIDVYKSSWDFWNEKSEQVFFDTTGRNRDKKILRAAERSSPDIIFYLGGNSGSGLPEAETFKKLRENSKIVHLCCDSDDRQWWPMLDFYREHQCFDLQVGTDGPTDAPVDLSTLTPVNPAFYKDIVPKDIRCGFSGQTGGQRSSILDSLGGLVASVQRTFSEDKDSIPYTAYARFMRRCKMALNFAWTGSGNRFHVKFRVLEAALADAALIEMEGSPAVKWFPHGSFFLYKDSVDAEHIIRHATENQIAEKTGLLREIVITKYNPQEIYGQMLNMI